MLAFFTSLLPQFASTSAALLAYGLAFCAMTILWLSGYAAAVSRARRVFNRRHVRRVLDGVMGFVLVAFGLRLATERP